MPHEILKQFNNVYMDTRTRANKTNYDANNTNLHEINPEKSLLCLVSVQPLQSRDIQGEQHASS